MTTTPRTVGVIGLGAMGAPMTAHLVAAGHDVVVLHHSLHKTEGARPVDDPRHMAGQADLVLLMVPGAPEIDTLLPHLADGAAERDGERGDVVIAVGSTVSPEDVARWHRAHRSLTANADLLHSHAHSANARAAPESFFAAASCAASTSLRNVATSSCFVLTR